MTEMNYITMITEDYVSFETAKLLKEKGFDCACKAWYSEYTSQFGGEKYTSIEFDNHNKFNENYKFICSAPTLQMVMKWLREVHKLYINIWADPKDVENNDFDIIFRAQVYNGPSNYGTYEFSTYEEACEAAIKYCLENLI